MTTQKHQRPRNERDPSTDANMSPNAGKEMLSTLVSVGAAVDDEDSGTSELLPGSRRANAAVSNKHARRWKDPRACRWVMGVCWRG